MASFLHQYRYLLEQIVAVPEKPIYTYSLLAPESCELLPNPRIPLNEPKQGFVVEMINNWVQKTPEQPAIRQGRQQWTYADLMRQAHAIAQNLQTKGLKQGDTVAIYGSRSFGLIASMIGVLSSGGVLLLIERNLPAQRKQLLLQEGKAKKLLYIGNRQPEDTWLKEDLLENTLFVEPTSGSIDTDVAQNPEIASLPKLAPEDSAYIFFTSGTTAVPKAVMGTHKGLSHFLNWQRETFAIGPHDHSAQLTGLSFDVVLREIFLPLTSGATLCLPENTDTPSPEKIIRWLEDEQFLYATCAGYSLPGSH
jgi:non-ribosomal peptide synthetase component F